MTTVEGSLQANEAIVYTLPANQGQTLTATLEGEGVLLSVLKPDRQPVNDQANRVPSWKGTLDSNGDYIIRLSPVKGVTSSNYKLKLSLEPAASPSPSPSATPSPSPSTPPDYDVQLLTPSDPNGAQVSDKTSNTRIKRYLVNAQPGQVLKAELVQGAATLDIHYPSGRPVENASGVVTWSARVSEGGEYQIDVVAPEPTDFTLNVNVQEAPQQSPGNPP
jgi:serine/threonine-protein kinase